MSDNMSDNEISHFELLTNILTEIMKIHQRFNQIDQRLDRLEAKVDANSAVIKDLHSELADFKKQHHIDLRSIKELYYDQGKEINNLDRRIERAEENQRPKN